MAHKYMFYLIRWQLSTPILAVVPIVLSWIDINNYWVTAIIANLIGGLIFFWVDKIIFKKKPQPYVYWEIKDFIYCEDCGDYGEGRRVVINGTYNREEAPAEFRCKVCANIKLKEDRK